MPEAPPTFRPPWLPRGEAKAQAARRHDERRGSARERGYDSRWDKARAGYLAVHPACICCAAHGVVHPASVVDHIEPHKGDRGKFWDSGNWQPLCEWCDKNLKRVIENRWLAHREAQGALRLDRLVAGWVHPAAR